jgi:hypothetical protein
MTLDGTTGSGGFCGRTKERPAGRIEMRSRGFSPVLAQKNPLNVITDEVILL